MSSRFALLIVAGVAACTESGTTLEPNNPTDITILPLPSLQLTGVVGQAAQPQPTVRLVDAKGRPLASEPVEFAVRRGGGTIAQAATVTDANGEARVQWILGTTVDLNLLSVFANSRKVEIQFSVYPQAGPPARVKVFDYGHIDAVAFAAESLSGAAVMVSDEFGNAVPKADISFQVTAGGGHLNNGQDSIRVGVTGFGLLSVAQMPVAWTLGRPGANRVTAALPGGPSASFDVVALDSAAVTWYSDAATFPKQKLALSADGYFIHELWSASGSPPARYVGTYATSAGTITLNGCSVGYFDTGDLICNTMSGQASTSAIVLNGRTYLKQP